MIGLVSVDLLGTFYSGEIYGIPTLASVGLNILELAMGK